MSDGRNLAFGLPSMISPSSATSERRLGCAARGRIATKHCPLTSGVFPCSTAVTWLHFASRKKPLIIQGDSMRRWLQALLATAIGFGPTAVKEYVHQTLGDRW